MTQDRNFHKSCQKDGDKVGENPAALRAAVFLLSAKNRRGVFKHPPSRAKVRGKDPPSKKCKIPEWSNL